MKYFKPITVEFVKCDFCNHTTEERTTWISQCAVCGKDICNYHNNTKGCEDGILCPNCSKKYEFYHSGGVAVVDIKTGKHVEAPYL